MALHRCMKIYLKAVCFAMKMFSLQLQFVYASHMKKNYWNLEKWLLKIHYEVHKPIECADLKIIVLIAGLQQSITKFSCFLCERECCSLGISWQN